MSVRAAIGVALALLVGAPSAAQQTVVFQVDSGSPALDGTLHAIGSDATGFDVAGTLTATVTLDAGETRVEAFRTTDAALVATQVGSLDAVFGAGLGPGGADRVSLSLSSTPATARLDGPLVDASPAGPGAATFPLMGHTVDLVAGSFTVAGSVAGTAVSETEDFDAIAGDLGVGTGTALVVLDETTSPKELRLTLPVALAVLVLPQPMVATLRLEGDLVLRGSLCETCAAACNDALDNDGDGLVDGGDPGCDGVTDVSEHDVSLACDNGLDDDLDGWIDAAPGGDPVCVSPGFFREDSECQDGIDNDGKLGTDFDGGESVLGVGRGDPDGPDPQCVGKPERNNEKSIRSCGLGAELGVLLPLLVALRRLRAR